MNKKGLLYPTAILLSVLLTAKCFGQDTAIVFLEIKQFDSLNKDQIFDRVKLWAVDAFKKTSGSMQVDDREAGLLAYDGSVKEISPKAPTVKNKNDAWKLVPFLHTYDCKVKIQIKGNRYRVEISDIRLIDSDNSYPLTSAAKAPYTATFTKQSKLNEDWADAKLTFNDFANRLFDSLEMAVKKNDDW